MSYSHLFDGLDLPRLQSIFGSQDEALVAHILQAQSKGLADKDGFFEDQLEVTSLVKWACGWRAAE